MFKSIQLQNPVNELNFAEISVIFEHLFQMGKENDEYYYEIYSIYCNNPSPPGGRNFNEQFVMLGGRNLFIRYIKDMFIYMNKMHIK